MYWRPLLGVTVGLKLLILLILVRRILRVFSTGMKIGFDVHVERGKCLVKSCPQYILATRHTLLTNHFLYAF